MNFFRILVSLQTVALGGLAVVTPAPKGIYQGSIPGWGTKFFLYVRTQCHIWCPITGFIYLLPPATKLGQGYVFTGVCDSVHMGVVPDQVHPPGTRYPPDQVPPRPGTLPGTSQIPPRTRYTPGTSSPPGTRCTPLEKSGTPQDQVHPWHQVHPPGPGTPPDQVHPLGPGTPPWDQVHPPQHRACWEIRPTRGRYASYWNAILLFILLWAWRHGSPKERWMSSWTARCPQWTNSYTTQLESWNLYQFPYCLFRYLF